MKFILSTIIIFILVILQSSLYPFLNIYNAFPNLILIFVLISSILRGYKKSLTWIIIGGLFLDTFSFNNPIGISIFGLFLVSYLAHFFSQNIFKKTSPFSVLILGISGIVIYRLFLVITLLIFSTGFQFSFIQITFEVIYNIIILMPLFYLLKRFWKI